VWQSTKPGTTVRPASSSSTRPSHPDRGPAYVSAAPSQATTPSRTTSGPAGDRAGSLGKAHVIRVEQPIDGNGLVPSDYPQMIRPGHSLSFAAAAS
jgi:hypothetical protein